MTDHIGGYPAGGKPVSQIKPPPTSATAKKCWCGGAVQDDACQDSEFHDWRDSKPTGPVRRLYLSGPMSGYPECNYPAFMRHAAELEEVGYQVENPAAAAVGSSYREILKEDIRQLMTCDGVAVMEGWWLSKGATIEVQIAGVLQMPVRPVSEWQNMVLYGGVDRPCVRCGDTVATEGFIVCLSCLAETHT